MVADLILRASRSEIAESGGRHPLEQQTRCDLVIGGEDHSGVELFGLQHVVLDDSGEIIQRLALVAVQRHYPLIRLRARQAIMGVECNGTAPLPVHVREIGQACVICDVRHHFRRGAKAEIGFYFRHCELDRPIAVHLQDQRPIEIDARLHQHPSGRHLTNQRPDRRRKRAHCRAPSERFTPTSGHAHQRTPHRQAFEQEPVQSSGVHRDSYPGSGANSSGSRATYARVSCFTELTVAPASRPLYRRWCVRGCHCPPTSVGCPIGCSDCASYRLEKGGAARFQRLQGGTV